MSKIIGIAIFFICLLSLASCQDEYKKLRIGMSITDKINEAHPIYDSEIRVRRTENSSNNLKIGALVFQAWANDHSPLLINGENYTIEIDIRIDDYMDETIQGNYQQMIDDGIEYFVTGLGTGPSHLAAQVTDPQQKLLVSSTTTSETFHENRDYSFSVYPTLFTSVSSMFPHFRLRQVANATFLKSIDNPSPVTRNVCNGLEEELEKNYINDYYYVYFTHNLSDVDNYTRAAQQVKEIDSDLVIHCDIDSESLSAFVRLYKEMDYTPRSGVSLHLDFTFDQELMSFWTMPVTVMNNSWDFPEGTYIKSEDEYLQYLNRLMDDNIVNTSFDDISWKIGYFSTIAFEVILSAINSTEKANFTVDDVKDQLRRNVYTSFLGEISYDARNRILYPGVGIQFVNGTDYNILGPHTIANELLVYPMPTWKERVYSDSFTAVEIVVIVLVGIAVLNSIAWIIVIIVKREEKRIVASSPVFLMSMLVGSILVYISLLFSTPHKKTDAGCSIYVGFLLVGFLLLFGSMLVKTWRVHLLFSRKSLDVFQISNSQVALFLAILLSVDIILFLLWSILSKPKLELVVPDKYRPSEQYYKCTSTKAGTVIVWIMVAYHGLLFLYGAYLALRVRTVPFKIYDESKIIAFCIYNVGLVAIIVAILEGTNAANRMVQFSLRSFLIILSTAITVNTMMIGKFAISKFLSVTGTSSHSKVSYMYSTTTEESLNSTSYVDWENEYNKLRKENKKLQDEVKKLTNALKALRGDDDQNNDQEMSSVSSSDSSSSSSYGETSTETSQSKSEDRSDDTKEEQSRVTKSTSKSSVSEMSKSASDASKVSNRGQRSSKRK